MLASESGIWFHDSPVQKRIQTKALLSIYVCMGLNDDVISLCIYSDGLLQPRNLQLGSHFIIIGVNVILHCILSICIFSFPHFGFVGRMLALY